MAPKWTRGPSGPKEAPAPTCVERTRRETTLSRGAKGGSRRWRRTTLSDAVDALKYLQRTLSQTAIAVPKNLTKKHLGERQPRTLTPLR